MKVINSLSEKRNLINHINAILDPRDTPIQEDDIEFSSPSVIPNVGLDTVIKTNPNSTYVYNTEIVITPNPRYYWSRPTTLQYRRVDLGLQWQILHPTIDAVTALLDARDINPNSQLEIKNKFLQWMPIKGDSVVIEVRDDDLHRDHIKKILITPIANSLLYIGSMSLHIQVSEAPAPSKPSLDDLFNGSRNPDGSANTNPTTGDASPANGYTNPHDMDGMMYAVSGYTSSPSVVGSHTP